MIKVVWDAKSQFKELKDKSIFDAMIAEYLLSYGKSIPTLESTLDLYKVDSIEKLDLIQQKKLTQLPKLNSLLTTIEIPLIKVLWNMEQNGITLDVECLKNVGIEIDKEIVTTEKLLHKKMGQEINLASAMQIGNYLAEVEKVPLKKTKTGRFATNENELVQHAENFPLIKELLKHRMLSKLRSTYVDSLIQKVDTDNRVHTTYHQVAANTGRLASSNPNLQNIPVTSTFGQKIKSCFIASPGNILISFDYSQQELRILAHLTNEAELIKAFTEKKDVHKITASKIFSTKYENVTKEQRMIGKTINFGIIYGMSSYGLSMSLHISSQDAQKFIDSFYSTYPNIKKFYDEYFRLGKINGYVETLLGRRRFVFEFPGQKFIDNNTRRVLLNYPVQGSAADLIKIAMVKIQSEVLDYNPEIKLLLQIHDDLVFEVKNEKKVIENLVKKVRDIMCNVYPLTVPIEVDVKSGLTWGEMKKLD